MRVLFKTKRRLRFTSSFILFSLNSHKSCSSMKLKTATRGPDVTIMYNTPQFSGQPYLSLNFFYSQRWHRRCKSGKIAQDCSASRTQPSKTAKKKKEINVQRLRPTLSTDPRFPKRVLRRLSTQKTQWRLHKLWQHNPRQLPQ